MEVPRQVQKDFQPAMAGQEGNILKKESKGSFICRHR
jgi:hypothetical protein